MLCQYFKQRMKVVFRICDLFVYKMGGDLGGLCILTSYIRYTWQLAGYPFRTIRLYSPIHRHFSKYMFAVPKKSPQGPCAVMIPMNTVEVLLGLRLAFMDYEHPPPYDRLNCRARGYNNLPNFGYEPEFCYSSHAIGILETLVQHCLVSMQPN